MEELLFGLTPAEWWVWNYLIYLARKQGGLNVTLPRPGEDPRAEKVFCRKHLKNIIKSLKSKRHLTNIIIPRSKSKRIEVFLPASKVGELEFPNREKGYLEFPNKEGMGNSSSPITTLGKNTTPISAVIQDTLPHYTAPQAKLKERLEKLLKLSKQGDLKGEIKAMNMMEQTEVFRIMRQICRFEPRGKKLSKAARLYAMVRFAQSGEAIEKAQAWIDKVAREAEREMTYGAQAYPEKVAAHHPQGDQAKARAL